MAGDGQQFRAHLLAEDACLGVALDAGQGAAAHGRVNMDVAVGEKFRAGADRRQDDQVAALGIDLLAAAHRAGDDLARLDLGFCGLFRLFRGTATAGRIDRALAGTGGRQHRQIQGAGGGDVVFAVGAHGQGAQAMVAAQGHQGAQVEAAFAFRQLVQGQYQRGIAEEVRCLGDFRGQLLIEALEVVVRQFHHGDGQHAALELEYGVLLE
ncbi:hypothetical protein D3C86_1527250 [compost metagenome]